MPQLRLVLLIIGAVFVLAVVIFEVRRSRRNRPVLRATLPDQNTTEPARPREPTLTLPEIHVRHRASDPPLIAASDADSMVGLRLDGLHPEQDTGVDLPPIVPAASGPETTGAFAAMVPLAPMTPETTLGIVGTSAAGDLPNDLSTAALPAAMPPHPVIDWPDESVRRIYSLRLMSSSPERFSGRTLRLALAGEGFAFGPFDIFHKPASDGRVIVSASSLTKPGTFDLLSMDSQRFLGVSLFVVLPGPLAPRAAIDAMFNAGRELAVRLDALLQDDHGRSVTPEIIDALRDAAARD